MKAVMYGGGNIGRGFIGMLFSQSGYEVTFIDVAKAVVEEMNRERRYPVRIVYTGGHQDLLVEPVSAVDGNEQEKTAQTIADADIMATAVGVRVLPYIVPNIAAGIRKRREQNGGPLNIIICENLIDADKLMDSLLRKELEEDDTAWYEKNVGLVEASIGRMVPVQTDEMRDGEPLRVCVERYGFLPVDKAAFKGEVPRIRNLVPFEPFGFYIERKLYVHNMGHSVCAYFGDYLGKKFIFQSIGDSDVRYIVENAMLESARAVAGHYEMELEPLLLHVQDLLNRFTNEALQDTCARVGGDPARKLSPKDRLIGSISLCLEKGIYPAFIMAGAAAAVYRYIREADGEQGLQEAERVLKEVSGIEEDSEALKGILDLYQMLLAGAVVKQIADKARAMEAEHLGEII